MLTFLCYPKCTTCQKARRWLDENNIEYVLRDIKTEKPSLEELTDCIPSHNNVFEEYENGRLSEALNRFLYAQNEEKRAIFIRRYFYSQSVEEISSALGMSNSKVKVTLYRLREILRKELEEQALL